MKIMYLLILVLLLVPLSVSSSQSTQQFNKIYLNPFYRASTSLNNNYNYSVVVNPPDRISSVKSAIITFQVYMTPTVTFNLTVNGRQCNNPTYVVSTTYSGSGQGDVTFDCTNVINSSGTYNMVLRVTQANTGAITGWLDMTYMNSPMAAMDVFGTEYLEGDDATVFLQLRDGVGEPITNATCRVSIYYPASFNVSHPAYLTDAMMLYLKNGIYYYDLTAPEYPGLYITDVTCRYTVQDIVYYDATIPYGPTRNVTLGAFTGDTLSLNSKVDNLYTRCVASAGGTKNCDSYYEWRVDSNITALNAVMMGESTVAVLQQMYYWNWTSSAWVLLPNSVTYGATATSTEPSGVEDYLANPVPLGAINGSGSVRIRMYTNSGTAHTVYTNWLSLVASRTVGTIQDLRGGSEIHVTNPLAYTNPEERFYRIDSCNGFTDGRCAIFTNDGEFDLAEGELEEIINISALTTQHDTPIAYTSPFSVDCTALYWVKVFNETSALWEPFEDYTLYSDAAEENCIITLNVDLHSGEEYKYWFKFDNYMKWEMDWTEHMITEAVFPKIQELCVDRNFTYEDNVPMNESTVHPVDLVTHFCLEAYDDDYWFNTYYNDSLLADNAGEFASYLQEARYYRSVIYDRYNFLLLGNNTPFMSEYYAKKNWEYTPRNLTYYPVQTDLTNYTKVQEFVWSFTNRTITGFSSDNETLSSYINIIS